ncbi:MAG: thiosulfate oxidation carrier protein SoxY [Hyphomicrobiaceae bacterium]|nr:thiosulfate oxidation carrier protein SoxY [Hyphomicrobiaceae bacterium]
MILASMVMQTRRNVLAGAAAMGTIALIPVQAAAAPELLAVETARLTGGAAVKDGRVQLTIPALAENGFSVFTTVEVDSPMTAADHVRRIHILSERNPIAHLLTWHIGPRSGIAKVSTNIRLAATQQITALVEMSDGSFWRDRKEVVVTVAACIDGR